MCSFANSVALDRFSLFLFIFLDFLSLFNSSNLSEMALSFYGLLEAALLVLNGIAVLHKDRFLKKVFQVNKSDFYFLVKNASLFQYGLTVSPHSFESQNSVKNQIVGLILAVQTVMRSEDSFSCLTTKETAIEIFLYFLYAHKIGNASVRSELIRFLLRFTYRVIDILEKKVQL